MNIVFESELMENQKHAVVMAPDLAFEALQSQDGDSLFFSIGTDHIFYITREVTATSTGWSKVDLSSALSSEHGGASVAVKAFSVSQNAQTLAIDLALVLTVGGADFLYLSLGNANTDDAWANGVAWVAIPFDAGIAPNPLTIADVFIMNIPAAGGGSAVENIFVDILRTPGDALNLLDRYYITPGASPQWNLHMLAADLAAGSISSCLGQRTGDPLPGIYTFGTISNEQELIFTPQYNYFKPTVAPSPARLTLPTGASAIASAINSSGVSNLFVAATDGLYVFTPDNQHDQATAVQIVTDSVVAGASALAAATAASQTSVWGLDPQGNLFYVMCPEGSEADPTAWSNPVPLVDGAEDFAFYLNLNAGNNVLFAHVGGQNLIQLTQDPVTTDWQQRSIMLPSTSSSDVAAYHSFTTHIKITDDNKVPTPNAAVAITATSPVSLYLNDVYYRLSPTVPVNTTADLTGVLTVVQETESLAGVCFQVTSTDASQTVAKINPMSKALATLGTVQNGDDLGNIQVTNEDGTQQPLVPTSVSSDDRNAAAQSIVQFVKINSGLPQDGSRQTPNSDTPKLMMSAPTPAARSAVPKAWGVSFAGGGLKYHEGEDAIQHFAMLSGAATPDLADVSKSVAPGSIGSEIKVAAGDFFHWLKKVFDDVEHFVVQEADGIYHFLATIADKVYHVLLDCIDAVAHAVEFVFNKIKVFFEDLIKWVGFIFNWNDILRTHKVMKNILNQYLTKSVNSMTTARTDVQNAFTNVETYIDSWAGIPNNIPPSLSGTSLDSSTSSSQPAPGQDSPQSNWGMHHLKSNAANGSTDAQPNSGIAGDVESLLKPLLDALETEKEVIKDAYDSFRSDVIHKIHQLSFGDLMKAVIGIITDAVLESVENVLLAAIDVLISLTEGAIDALNATIDIPVISWLYKKIAKEDLSLMDVTCLVAAIPVTIVYKLITEEAPFPDDDTTTALINAPDFASIQNIFNSSAPAPMAKAFESKALVATISTPENKKVVLAGGIMSVVGAIAVSFFGPLQKKSPNSKVFPVLNSLSYLLYVSPDVMGQIPDLQNKKWWAIFNETITDLMVVKTLVDMGNGLRENSSKGWSGASPWLECAGNIIWQVPTTAALYTPENLNTAGALNFYAGTCFDFSGMLSPALADDKDPDSWLAVVILAGILNLAYGAMSCAASVLTFKAPASSATA